MVKTKKIEKVIVQPKVAEPINVVEEIDVFKENKVYHFTKDGRMIPESEATPDTIKMAKLIPITKEEFDKMTVKDKVIFRDIPDTKINWYDKLLGKWLKYPTKNVYQQRTGRVHQVAKNLFFKPALKVLKKVMGKYVIKTIIDIPTDKHNNHHRIFYHCWQEALLDTFVGPNWEGGQKRTEAKQFVTKEEYVKWLQETKFWSWDNRSSVINLWMTEIMEDTFDREWMNYFMLRMYHEMNELYQGNVPKTNDYPHFTGMFANNPSYFVKFNSHPQWNPKGSWNQQIKAKEEIKNNEPKPIQNVQ